jgi:hypothetical protein
MDRTQATLIQTLLLDAADAIDRVSAIVFTLDSEDRAILSVPLDEISSALHFELLQKIYLRYPGLQPPAEQPVINTTIRWDDVVLPESVTEADLDRTILSVLNVQWRKTAPIIGNALKGQQVGLPINAELLGARIQALADADRLDSQGDLRSWRHSEVRLKR